MPNEEELSLVEERRWDIGGVAVNFPGDRLGIGEVAAGALEPDGEHGLELVAAGGVEKAIGGHGRGHDIVRQAAAFPDDLAGGKIIASNPGRCRDHGLGSAGLFDDQRRGPG